MNLESIDIDGMTNEELAELALELKEARDAERAQRAGGEAAASAAAGGQPMPEGLTRDTSKPVAVATTSPAAQPTDLSPLNATHKVSAEDIPDTDENGVPLLPEDRWAHFWANVKQVN